MATKKVRMIAQISGTHDGKEWPAPGETVVLPAVEADDMIRAGLAADPSASEEENALADVLGVETATVGKGKAGQKSVRTQIKPAPHADEPQAYHVPELPGERAAAEAGQKAVDEANKDLGVPVEENKDKK